MNSIVYNISQMKRNRAFKNYNRRLLHDKKLDLIGHSNRLSVFNSEEFKPKSDDYMKKLRSRIIKDKKDERMVKLVCLFVIVDIVILVFFWMS